VTADHLPAFGAARATAPAGRRLLARALARPSLGALVGLVVVVVFFGLQAPELLGSGGLASILDIAALLGIGGVPVALLLIAGQFDLSVGVVAVASSLVTALLIGQAGWGVWPALMASLAGALLVGVVNGLLVVSTGLPSFLVTLATFLVLQGTTLAGTQLIAGSARIEGLDTAAGWNSAVALFGSTVQLGAGRFRVSILWWLGVTALAAWALWRTRFGNAVFASGGPGARPASSASRSGGRRRRCSASPRWPDGCSAPSGWSASAEYRSPPGWAPGSTSSWWP